MEADLHIGTAKELGNERRSSTLFIIEGDQNYQGEMIKEGLQQKGALQGQTGGAGFFEDCSGILSIVCRLWSGIKSKGKKTQTK